MRLELSPTRDEPEFGDSVLAGEWIDELPHLVAGRQERPWCAYAARRDGALVGMGSFKQAPGADGWVEIGYMTLTNARNSGVAGGIALRLIDIARSGGARGVCAHTLPWRNWSARVLAAAGFSMVRQYVEPDDGPIWRWELTLG